MKTRILSILAFLTICIGVNAQVNIPDANFKAYLVGNTAINTNNDAEIQVSEATAFTSYINVNNLSISDLTGIEAFTNLTELFCTGNALTTIDVSSNTALVTFLCDNNALTSLNVSANNALEYLDCKNNSIASLDISNNTALRILNCRYNNLTSLDVSSNNSLTDLDCENNSITSLNASNKPTLWDLRCHNNALTTLDVSNSTALVLLYCMDNALTSLDVTANIVLEQLRCDGNSITDLDLSNNTALQELYCEDNALTLLNVDTGSPSTIGVQFDARNNNLTCVQVHDVAYSNLFWANRLDATASFSANCSACVVNIPDANFKTYLVGNTSINTNNDTEIQCSEATAFTGLINCPNLSISDLTGIEAFTNLTQLVCADNALTSIDVSNNTALEVLYCYNNALTGLNVSANTSLYSLFCTNNLITSLDVSNNTALTTLLFKDNMLTSIDTSNNSILNYLDCTNNSLTSLDISANTVLTDLRCSTNQLTSLNVAGNTDLTRIECFNNSITSLDLSSHADLFLLLCFNNALTSLNIANGNNTNMQVHTNPAYYNYINNPNLTCIQVDDETFSNANWSAIKDATASYSTNCAPPSTPVIYVNHAATGANDGTSWADAYTDLQDALATFTNVWVAKGTYKPTATTDRNASFNLTHNVYGGFDGTETNLSDRDLSLLHTTNETILDGDLAGNDNASQVIFGDAFKGDNSYHVVEVISTNLEINGFTIQNGHADALSGDNRFGGGVFKNLNAPNLTVKNCVIKNNIAFSGAGLSLSSNDTSNIIIDACIIDSNLANVGAGLDLHMSAQNKDLTISITNSLFKNNKTEDDTAKGRNGDGAAAARLRAYFNNVTLNATIVNNTFVNNSSLGNTAGATGNFPVIDISKNNGGFGNITVANNIFWGNVRVNSQTAPAIGKSSNTADAFDSVSSTKIVNNNTDEGNLSTISGPTNTLSTDPNLDAYFQLTSGSSAIDSGDNGFMTIALDLAGNQRIFNTTVDRGAYEFGSTPLGVNNFSFLENKVTVYPNPTTTVLNIKMDSNLKRATIYSVLGAKVLETTSQNINTSNLKSGMYLITIEDENGSVSTKRFIKQ